MKINHKKVEQLKSFNGVKLRGNETFDELLEIEKKQEKKKIKIKKREEKFIKTKIKFINETSKNQLIKGTIICKAKKCNNYLYKNQSQINPQYCLECI